MSADQRLNEVLEGQTDEPELEDNIQLQENVERAREDRFVSQAELEKIVIDAIDGYLTGFEDRLATQMQKALDTVLYEYDERIRAVEEDQARILRHLGLEGGE